MQRNELLRFARAGAEAQIAALEQQIEGIRKQLPSLGRRSPNGRGFATAADGLSTAPVRRRRKMSAAGKKRISDAAKKRWAAWRKANEKN